MRSLEIELDTIQFQSFIEIVLREGASTRIYRDPFFLMKALKLEIAKALTNEALAVLEQMQEGVGPGIIHLKGLPQDEYLPAGESALERSQQKTRVSESVILALSALLGCYLFSKETEQEGRIFHNVSPVKGKENVVSSVGRDPFYYHTEIAYSPEVPKFLMLFCLESDPTAKTSYFFIQDILAGIPEAIKITMRKPVFSISAVSGYDVDITTAPLLAYDPETQKETFRFYQNIRRIEAAPRTEEERVEVEACLAFLVEHAEKTFPKPGEEPAVGLRPGEALIFNNGWAYKGQEHHGVMHGRVGFIQNPKRWLQRGYFSDTNHEIREKIDGGYTRFLKHMVTSKKVPFKLAVSCLKTAIAHSEDYQKLNAENPDAIQYSDSQRFFHGVQPRKSQDSWLERIAHGADVPVDPRPSRIG